MSRIGKALITLPAGVTLQVAPNNMVTVKGPKGELHQQINPELEVAIDGSTVEVKRPSEIKRHKALHGLSRALLQNMVVGVSQGYRLEQELVGVGYKAVATGSVLDLSLGYSHEVVFQLPVEVKVTTTAERGKNPTIILEAADKQLIGAVAAKIRSLRVPEPYKGKGIRFVGEVVRRKAGKTASKK